MKKRVLRWTSWIVVLAASGGIAGHGAAGGEVSGESNLSGYVYVDQNFDGTRDPVDEWVLPDIEISLSKLSDPQQIFSTLTGFDGRYTFSGLNEGTYTLVQPEIPQGYLTVVPNVGELFDPITGDPSASFPGNAVNYDQQNSIPPQVAGIEIPEFGAVGLNYDFGQVWWGKAWEISPGNPGTPPGGQPPQGIPEPSALVLLFLGLVAVGLGRFR